jgi:hypothetical protein
MIRIRLWPEGAWTTLGLQVRVLLGLWCLQLGCRLWKLDWEQALAAGRERAAPGPR